MRKRILSVVLVLIVFLAGFPFLGNSRVDAAGQNAMRDSVRNSLIGTWELVDMVNIYIPDLGPDYIMPTLGRAEYFADGTGRQEYIFTVWGMRQSIWGYFDWEITPPNIIRIVPRPTPGMVMIELAEYHELIFREPYAIAVQGGRI